MVLRRIVRRWLSGVLVLAILFTQVATAAHACPALGASEPASASAAMPCAGMMGAGMALDADQPGLCQQHCQIGNAQQAGDPAHAFALPEVTRALLFVVNPVPDAHVAPAPWAARRVRRDAAPPLSVLHCCYRF